MNMILKLTLVAAALAVGVLGTWTTYNAFASPGRGAAALTEDPTREAAFRMTEERETLSVPPTGTLRASAEDVSLRLTAGAVHDEARLRVHVTGTSERWARAFLDTLDPHLEIRPSGARLTVGSTCELRDYWRSGARTWVTLEVELPAAYGVDVETEDGAVSVAGLAGAVDVRTDDGEVEVHDLRGPSLSIETSDGAVAAHRIEAERQWVRTSDARVSIQSLAGELSVTTHDGDIEARLGAPTTVALRSQEGDIRIALAPDLGVDLSIEAPHVEIAESLDLEVTDDGSKSSGRLHRGGPPVAASSHEGSISVVAAAEAGD